MKIDQLVFANPFDGTWVSPTWRGFAAGETPWSMARRESSVFPDIDQMLEDIGPVIDAEFDRILSKWVAIATADGFALVPTPPIR